MMRHPRAELVGRATEKIHYGIYKEGKGCISWTNRHMKVLEGKFMGKKYFIHIFSFILQNMIFVWQESRISEIANIFLDLQKFLCRGQVSVVTIHTL
jgi:hypothetical protein